MSNPIDEQTYGDMSDHDPDDVEQGNPGQPQSDFVKSPADGDNGKPGDAGTDYGRRSDI